MPIQFAKSHEQSNAFKRYNQLTMPPGALQRVFKPALQILAQQKNQTYPFAVKFASAVFAGDHAVAKIRGVSAFPSEVTAQMLINFVMGGAAMSVLSRQRQSHLYAIDIGVAHTYELPPADARASGVTYLNCNLSTHNAFEEKYPHGALDITQECALSAAIFENALQCGRETVKRAIAEHNPDVLMLGEMGIGNTTPSTAIICHTLGISPSSITGPGTGINSEQKKKKSEAIQDAINRHKNHFGSEHQNPKNILRSLGGFEIAAIAGAAEEAAANGKFVLLDGTIATAAILPFALKYPEFRSWLIAGHVGSEPAHQAAIHALELQPLLNLDLRLGEGSGAALAAGIILDAVAMLNEMATFASAGVSANA